MSLEEKVIVVIDPEVGQMDNMVTVYAGGALGELSMKKPVTPAVDDLQEQIGVQLRAVYETLISEPVPDRFLNLLEELDRRKDKKK